MDEYISRETLLKAVEKMDRLDKETKTKYEYDKEGYILLIQNAPASDVVEVVRCKDCKHAKIVKHRGEEMSDIFRCTYLKPNTTFFGIDFCRYGERRDT